MSPAQRRSSALRRWLVVVVVLAAAGAGLAVAYLRSGGADPAGSGSEAAATQSGGATGVPTVSTAVDPRAPGTEPIETDPPTRVATDTPYVADDGAAAVAITYAGWDPASSSVQVNAFAAGLVQDGGTCTLTLTRGADTRTATSPAEADATTTICHLLRVSGDQLTSGSWKAVVAYSSGTAKGRSASVEVTVP